jgi:hypothetical protein
MFILFRCRRMRRGLRAYVSFRASIGVGDKRTVVRVSRCWELFASATLLEREFANNTL